MTSYAIIFLKTKPPKSEDVRRSILSIPEALAADHIFGPYDIICPVRAMNLADLERVLINIQTSSSGIKQTMTCIVKEVY